MTTATLIFWASFALVAYTYVGYPLVLALLAACFGRRRRVEPITTSFSLLMTVHNEEKNLRRRLDELTGHFTRLGLPFEIIVVSDASTDHSAAIAREYSARGVRVLELAEKQGKAAGLALAAQAAQHELLIFADARQRWADDALARLSENFADPRVGAVSGDLVLEAAPGVLAGVGLYWRFEKWLRTTESKLWAQVGVTGAISACRRTLFRAPPPGTLLDDVYWPMQVARQGYRVVHDGRAAAFDRLPPSTRDEFRRKVRTLAGNFQLAGRLPGWGMVPWTNFLWWQFLSHKLLRLAVPWFLLAMFAASASLAQEPLYFCLTIGQAAGYALGLLGFVPAIGKRVKILGAAASFLVLNAAAWLAFWVWITGHAGNSWKKIDYAHAPRSQGVWKPESAHDAR